MTEEEYAALLRDAKPRLLACIEGTPSSLLACKEGPPPQYAMFISDGHRGWDELIEEGFDPIGTTGAPVYYRVVRRGDEMFYLSTVMAPPDVVLKWWGTAGLAHCEPVTGWAPMRIETRMGTPETVEQESKQIQQLAKEGNRQARHTLRIARARAKKSKERNQMNENDLRSAKPRLICCMERSPQNERLFTITALYISDGDLGWDKVLREGFDASGGTGLGPVYFRIVRRGDDLFYLSVFKMSGDVLESWGSAGLKYCDPISGTATVCLEIKLPFSVLPAGAAAYIAGACAQAALAQALDADAQTVD